MTSDNGSIVLGWLTKLALTLGVLGLIGFDGIAVATTHFAAADHAGTVAIAAAGAYNSTHDVQRSYDTAVAAAAETGDTVEAKTFVVSQDGHVTLTLHREASTLWLHRIGALKKYDDVTAVGQGSPPS